MLDKILDPDPAILGAVAVVIEIILRLVKSKKPLSIAHGLAGILKKVADYAGKAASLLDQVLPQKTK